MDCINIILASLVVAYIVIAFCVMCCFYQSGQISEEERQMELQTMRLNRLYGRENTYEQ